MFLTIKSASHVFWRIVFPKQAHILSLESLYYTINHVSSSYCSTPSPGRCLGPDTARSITIYPAELQRRVDTGTNPLPQVNCCLKVVWHLPFPNYSAEDTNAVINTRCRPTTLNRNLQPPQRHLHAPHDGSRRILWRRIYRRSPLAADRSRRRLHRLSSGGVYPLAAYYPPAPPLQVPAVYHHYTLLLFSHTNKNLTISPSLNSSLTYRIGFNLSDFVATSGLGPLVAATYFELVNTTSTSNSSVSNGTKQRTTALTMLETHSMALSKIDRTMQYLSGVDIFRTMSYPYLPLKLFRMKHGYNSKLSHSIARL